MFLVNDSAKNRRKKIEQFMNKDEMTVAVLLAAADFEWTIRRVIVLLGKSPNKAFRDVKETDLKVKVVKGIFSKSHGLDEYKEIWKDEVSRNSGCRLSDVIKNWDGFKKSFKLRHLLIHGVQGTVGLEYGEKRVTAILDATRDLVEFAKKHNLDVFKNLPVRRKAREISVVDEKRLGAK
jgi:uncharacterized protein YehS (DUF1456 family)